MPYHGWYSPPPPLPPPKYDIIQISDSKIQEYLDKGWSIEKSFGNGYTQMYKLRKE